MSDRSFNPGSMIIVGVALMIAACASPTRSAAPSATSGATSSVLSRPAGEFYRGKTVRIVVGFAAGGPYDAFSRLVAQHMSRHLTGNPTIIVENKPGAGSILAANLVYGTEPKDGTVIASISPNLPLQQALGMDGIQFDAAKFNWLGSGNRTASVCSAATDAGVTSIQDLMGSNGNQLVIGTIGPGNPSHDIPAVLTAALGANLKMVSGYDGTAKLMLAFEGREIDGFCTPFDIMLSTARPLLEGDPPRVRVFVVLGSDPPDHPWLKGVVPARIIHG
jgi:tripartite-type tricarboxylate transporter receptor subunit TctC